MADEEKTLRTSKEQIECYLNFISSHPEIRNNKNDPTRPKRVQELWGELAEQLNALKGPRRTAAKWKECLMHWKNQVRSRARRSKAHKLVTGGGTPFQNDLSPLEERAIDSFGSVVVQGMSDVPTIGVEELFQNVVNESEMECGSSNEVASSPTSPASPPSPPSSSSGSRKRQQPNTSNEMFVKMMSSMNERNEEERQFRRDALKCFETVAESLCNVASAMLAVAEAVAKNIKK